MRLGTLYNEAKCLLYSSATPHLCSLSSSGLVTLVCHSPHMYAAPHHPRRSCSGMTGHMPKEQVDILSKEGAVTHGRTQGRISERLGRWLCFNIGVSSSQKEQWGRKGEKSPNIKCNFLKIKAAVYRSSGSPFPNAIPGNTNATLSPVGRARLGALDGGQGKRGHLVTNARQPPHQLGFIVSWGLEWGSARVIYSSCLPFILKEMQTDFSGYNIITLGVLSL